MGVLGLVPFLHKTCSSVLHVIPNRFQSLRGKRVVLDGTLLTQRLHFAPMPNPHRHVIGWYRIIKELQDSDVTAVCIFDGTQRSLAKQLEVERRRRIRRLTQSRGSFENDRLQRLRKLNVLLSSWHSLDDITRKRTSNVLHSIISRTAPPMALPTYMAGNLEYSEDLDALLERYQTPQRPVPSAPKDVYGAFDEADLSEVLLKQAGVPISASQDFYAEPFPHISEVATNIQRPTAPEGRSTAKEPHPHDDWAREIEPDLLAEVYRDDLTSRLTSLYMDYRQSIPQLASLANATPPPTAVSLVSSEEDSREIKEEYAMSKTQNQLTAEEGYFWEQFTKPTAAISDPEALLSSIVSLTEKSSVISDSYERRTHPPTAETYEESKAILKAMGVPCVETNGPYEAEALASSIVLKGLADFVGSEDTDVLVYEAPLLRNVANRNGPLVIIPGAEVRRELHLDRLAFVDFMLLLGTDFSRRIKNVGPHRALKFIRDHGSIERILERETQYPPRIPVPTYLEQISLARSVFQTLPPVPDPSLLVPGEEDEDKVMEILRQYGSHWAAVDGWNYRDALAGNYFADDPTMS
ncbi:unnamed protein product [Somion occarium]|uniref:PIN domain-like protein n=1 Tax=Somion occarium TaxID=3059160 RepID=A0ABP1CV48_9APHY